MTGLAAPTLDVPNVSSAAATASAPKRATPEGYPRAGGITPARRAFRVRDPALHGRGRGDRLACRIEPAGRHPRARWALPRRDDAVERARTAVQVDLPGRQDRLDVRVPRQAGRRDLPLHALQGDLPGRR